MSGKLSLASFPKTLRNPSRPTISSTIFSAVAQQIWVREIGTNLLWGTPEIVQAAMFIGKDIASRDKNAICADSLATIRKPE